MRIAFVANEVGIGLWRNFSMTVSVVIVTAVSLFFFGSGLLFQRQVDQIEEFTYNNIQISMFLCGAVSDQPSCAGGEVTQEQKSAIEADLEGPELSPFIETWFFESKQQAYDRFVVQFEGSALVEGLTVDQLPESYRVQLVDPQDSEVVVAYFSGRAGVEEVNDQRNLLDGLFNFLNGARWFAWVFALALLSAAVLLVATTIRLAAFNRRRETGIMRLVGASKFFIQLPFMLEGIVAALLGAVLATIGLFAAVRVIVGGYLQGRLTVTPYIGPLDVLAVTPVLFVLAIVLAGVSSLITLQRYLKV